MQREHTKGPRPKSLAERFWPKVDQRGDCWLWTGSINNYGYGMIAAGGRGGKVLKAHRVAWELTHGPVPDGLEVCHTCDQPRCVNPAHLWLGTHTENVRDMWRKGRGARLVGDASPATQHPERMSRGDQHGSRTKPERVPRGERQGNAKLADVQVREIRALYATGKHTQTALGARFGVSQVLIGLIVREKAWKHLL